MIGHLRSHAVGYLALLVALGGTSYAAATLPRNSVGSSQIRTNAVSSPEVRNGSLRAVDFAAGQLPGRPVRYRQKVSLTTAGGAPSISGVPIPSELPFEAKHVQPAGATEAYIAELSVRVPADCRFDNGQGNQYPGFATFRLLVDGVPVSFTDTPPTLAWSQDKAGKIVQFQLGQPVFMFEPATARQRKLTLSAGDNCNASNTDFGIEAVAINVLGFR